MLFCTGDTHGDFDRFKLRFFPERETMDRSDYVLICGDFGGLWSGTILDDVALDWLEALPFTTLFADGNHENYDLLYKLPVERWNGGKVHQLRPHVLHLMRGQVFNIDGRTFFTMGGASSHDVQDGILDRNDPEFDLKYYYLRREHACFRINHESWWKEELPSDDEYAEAKENLVKANHQVDFIITHCAPSSVEDIIGKSTYIHDRLTDFLEEVYHMVTFRHIVFLKQQISTMDEKIAEIMSTLDTPIMTITGIGPTLGAVIISEIGDISRFPSSAKLAAYAGIDPTMRQSGEYNGVRNRMSKRGSPYLRHAIWLAANAAVIHDPMFREYFQKKRSEGKPYMASLGHACRKMVSVIYAVIRDNKKYVPGLLSA